MSRETRRSTEKDARAFYAEHYSDWTVHELPLMVYVPLMDEDQERALALVQEILTEAAFDIRARVIPPGDDPREPAGDELTTEERETLGWAIERDWNSRDMREDWLTLHAAVERILRARLAARGAEDERLRAQVAAVRALADRLDGQSLVTFTGAPPEGNRSVSRYGDLIRAALGDNPDTPQEGR